MYIRSIESRMCFAHGYFGDEVLVYCLSLRNKNIPGVLSSVAASVAARIAETDVRNYMEECIHTSQEKRDT